MGLFMPRKRGGRSQRSEALSVEEGSKALIP
jgi:hypothetical protein